MNAKADSLCHRLAENVLETAFMFLESESQSVENSVRESKNCLQEIASKQDLHCQISTKQLLTKLCDIDKVHSNMHT